MEIRALGKGMDYSIDEVRTVVKAHGCQMRGHKRGSNLFTVLVPVDNKANPNTFLAYKAWDDAGEVELSLDGLVGLHKHPKLLETYC